MNFEEWKTAVIGNWRGTKQLYLELPPAPVTSSSSELSVIAVAGDSFVQLNYVCTYEGEAQTGVLLLGCDEQNAASAAWIDSFHMSSRIMFCTGSFANGAADLHGSYAAPPGPDWGWRINIRPMSADELQVVMHNISPEGQEDLAVQIDYTRAA